MKILMACQSESFDIFQMNHMTMSARGGGGWVYSSGRVEGCDAAQTVALICDVTHRHDSDLARPPPPPTIVCHVRGSTALPGVSCIGDDAINNPR